MVCTTENPARHGRNQNNQGNQGSLTTESTEDTENKTEAKACEPDDQVKVPAIRLVA